MKTWNKNWSTPLRVLLAGAAIAVSAMLLPMVVSAVAPPANTVIGNQASASYIDAAGKPQSSLSNQVNTTVTQIGAFTLSNTGNKTAAAGNIVYISHTLTNTGNGTDSFNITVLDNLVSGSPDFSNIAVYADANGTGSPSGAPLCASPSVSGIPLCSAGFAQSVGGNNGSFDFVVAYTIPGTATTPTTPFDTATVTAVPVPSAAGIQYATGTASRVDTVNLTTGAAFSATKSIAAPGVAAPGNSAGGWPTVVTSGFASTSGSCATTWTVGLNSSASCIYTVYTIKYNNTGASTGSFSMSDTLPSGLTYVNNSAVWSGAGGSALSETGGTTAGVAPNQIVSTYASGKFSATVSNVTANSSGSISFVALVNSTATAGTGTTINTALYSTVDCNAACVSSTPPGTPTNPTPFPVTPTYKVIAANISSATTFDGAAVPAKSGIELLEVTAAFLGNKVPFPVWVINKGNVNDVFNLSVALAGANNNFPANTGFAFFKADGATPLLDSNGDGIPDTGLLAPGAFVSVTVVASLPSTGAVPTGAVDALVTATSAGAGTSNPVIDSAWAQIDGIKSAKVDLTNTAAGNLISTDGGTTTNACTAGSNCDLGQGPSANPTFTTSTTTGTAAAFPLYLKNQETADSSYNLTYSVPPGWVVKFVAGTGTCASAAISQPIAVTAGAQPKVLPCVTPPTGSMSGTTLVTFTATKSTDPTVSDVITDAVQLLQSIIPVMQLGPITGTATTPNGGTTVTPVTLTNTGTTSCGLNGGFHVSVSIDTAGWSATVYYDGNKDGSITNTDPVIDTQALSSVANLTTAMAGALVPLAPAPGNTLGLPLLVKIFAPANATIGTTATATVVVTDLNSSPTTLAPACPAATGKYSATVTNGQLNVMKTQLKVAGTGSSGSKTCDGTVVTGFGVASLSGAPGDCIVYRIVATNSGSAPVTNVVVNDAVPPYTIYNGTQPATQCAATGNLGTPTLTTAGSGAGTTAMFCSAAGATGVTLNPLGTMTLFFAVQVQQ